MPRGTVLDSTVFTWDRESAALRELERQGVLTKKRKGGMIKLYRQTASQLLLMLDYIERNGLKLEAADAYVAPDSSDRTQYSAYQLVRGQRDENMSNKDLMEVLRKQLESEGDTDTDLVDAIVSALGMPYLLNRLTGATLDALKSAILRPDEVSELKRTLQDSLRCNVCKKPLNSGELIVGHGSGSGFGIRCLKCAIPEYTTCPSCDTRQAVSSALKARLVKMFMCPNCKANPAGAGTRDPNALGQNGW